MGIEIRPAIDAEEYESLHEDLRPYYQHDAENDQYVFSVTVEGGKTLRLEDVLGLKGALAKERSNTKDYTRLAAQYREELKEAQEKLQQHTEAAEAAPELADRVNQLQQEVSTLRGTLSQARADAAVQNAVASVRGTPGLAAYLRERIAVDGDGNVTPTENGQPILDADTGEPVRLSHFVQHIKAEAIAGNMDYAGMIFGAGSSGGNSLGAGGHAPRGGIPANLRRGQMTPKQKVEFIKEHGHDEFMKLPA